jgi:DNA repair exonuclease SbcCD ATPase subunit
VEDKLYIKLFQLRRRQALVQGVHRCLLAGLWGGWMCLPLMLLFGAWGLPPQNILQALWVWPLLAVSGFFHGLLAPMTLRQVAHQADLVHGQQDRLLTCLSQIQSRRPATVVSQLLLQETLERLDGLDPERTFPSRWRRPLLRWLVPALAIAAVLLLAPALLPPPPTDPLRQEVLASHQRLSKLSQRLAASRTRSRQHQQLQELLRRMPQQVPSQAARQLRNTLQSVQRQMAEQAQKARQLDQIGRGGQSETSQRKQLEALSKALAEQPEAQKLLEQAQKSLEQGHKEAAQKAMEEAHKQLIEGEAMQQQREMSQALQQELGQLDPQQRLGQDAPSEGEVAANPMPGSGKGKGQGDFGKGSTNQAGKSGDPARAKARGHRQNQQQRQKSEPFKQLYGADRKHLKTRRERVALSGAKGRLLRMSDSQLGQTRNQDPSLRPEQVDFLEAKAQAEQSVAEERVPPEHREAVRRYFDQIDPRPSNAP